MILTLRKNFEDIQDICKISSEKYFCVIVRKIWMASAEDEKRTR